MIPSHNPLMIDPVDKFFSVSKRKALHSDEVIFSYVIDNMYT